MGREQQKKNKVWPDVVNTEIECFFIRNVYRKFYSTRYAAIFMGMQFM